MKNKIHITNISELPSIAVQTNEMRKKVSCITIDYQEAISQFSFPVYLDAFVSILVSSGTSNVNINYKTYPIEANTLLLLSSSHLFNFEECSHDFQCICLFVGREFTSEMDSADMIFQRTKYGVRLYNTPVLYLAHQTATNLLTRIQMIDRAIDNTTHFYYKEVIKNSLFGFYLDVSDTIERYTNAGREGYLTRYENIIQSFIELLADNYRKEHKVDFYANRLNISAHYLTQIVRTVTGQSVSDFIFEMIYSESRNLLSHSKLSIQEIATMLNFSDQSSFGKFFKRKAGVSPVEFRKKRK